MIFTAIGRLRRLARDRGGATLIEMALIAPALFLPSRFYTNMKLADESCVMLTWLSTR